MKMRNALISSAVVVVIILVTILGSVFGHTSTVKAAVTDPWEIYSGNITLDDDPYHELYVVDAWVIQDGSTYEMWYTRGNSDSGISAIINGIKDLVLSDIYTDITNLDLDSLLQSLSDLNANTIASIIDGTSTVIGYATSTDGKTWTVEDSEVLAANSTDTWNGVGAPSVVKTDDTTYEMWYTNLTTDLNQTTVQGILDGLSGNVTERKAAVYDLLDSVSTSIGYATSDNGTAWAIVDSEVLIGNGNVWNSVGAPSVAKTDNTTYEMWYTGINTDIVDADLDDILAEVNAGTLTTTDLLDFLNGTATVINHATSTDGEEWAERTQVLPQTSGGVFDSVADPTVIKTDDTTYEMWYTNSNANLTSANLSALLQEIKTLPLDDLWASLKSLDILGFIDELDAVFTSDLNTIKNILSDTSSVIGYATSSNGTGWTVENSEIVSGSGGTWASIGAPTVVKTSSAYEMWYTEGIPDITAQDLVYFIDGTKLPIGYASTTLVSLVAETSIEQGLYNNDFNGAVVLKVNIDLIKDTSDNSTVEISGGIGSFSATVNSTPGGGIEILDVYGVSPFDHPSFNYNATSGVFSVDNATSIIQADNTTVAEILVRLTGNCFDAYDLTVAFQSIGATDDPGLNVPEEHSNTLTFQRGEVDDTDGNLEVTVADAVAIEQYRVGQLTWDDIMPLNAASASQDGPPWDEGDKISVADSVAIKQYRVGQLNSSYE
ncbi:hypothetical protein ACFLTO_03885 [Chloroflexota bacterium]